MKRHLNVLITVFFVSCFSISASAEIYRYKDPATGKWVFTDKPQGEDLQKSIDNADDQQRTSTKNNNYKELLEQKFSPQSSTEKATLAVVKVETGFGTGSGFFVSSDGYLVTNKHVIRPTQKKQKEMQEKLDKDQAYFQRQADRLSDRKRWQRKEKNSLEKYAKYVAGLSGAEKVQEKKDYNARYKRFLEFKKDTAKYTKEHDAAFDKWDQERKIWQRRMRVGAVSQSFKVQLKNRDQLDAYLIKISADHDLALLKVDDVEVPYFDLSENAEVRQTDRVYAIGSPLGRDDYISSGILTSLRKDRLITDATILPGNSGGPLIDEESVVIGVNTWKEYSRSIGVNEGFGIAIAADIVMEEFAEHLKTQSTLPANENSNF